MLVGAVSDTHGELPASIAEALAGVDRIVHAGDVGARRVLEALESIAPVTAVRGNMDSGELEWQLQDMAVIKVANVRIAVTHKASAISARGLPEGTAVVVTGHTHRAAVERIGDVLFVNPGSTGGKNRDGRGATAAIIDVSADPPTARIVEAS